MCQLRLALAFEYLLCHSSLVMDHSQDQSASSMMLSETLHPQQMMHTLAIILNTPVPFLSSTKLLFAVFSCRHHTSAPNLPNDQGEHDHMCICTPKTDQEDAGKWLCGQHELDDSNCSEAVCCHFPAASKKMLKNRCFLLCCVKVAMWPT